MREASGGTIDLHWSPLGAGAHVVRLSGRLYEALAAARQRRPAQPLYHSALEITVAEGRYLIEMGPELDGHGERRGVVGGGPVGSGLLRWLRVFRYEVRCWRGGILGDRLAATTARIGDGDEATARLLLSLTVSVPTPVWGRDELDTGEMWNSNSVTSWLLASAGFDLASSCPPRGGRAPGWTAGVVVATRAQQLRSVEDTAVAPATAP